MCFILSVWSERRFRLFVIWGHFTWQMTPGPEVLVYLNNYLMQGEFPEQLTEERKLLQQSYRESTGPSFFFCLWTTYLNHINKRNFLLWKFSNMHKTRGNNTTNPHVFSNHSHQFSTYGQFVSFIPQPNISTPNGLFWRNVSVNQTVSKVFQCVYLNNTFSKTHSSSHIKN